MHETNGDAWVIAAADVVVHTDVLGEGSCGIVFAATLCGNQAVVVKRQHDPLVTATICTTLMRLCTWAIGCQTYVFTHTHTHTHAYTRTHAHIYKRYVFIYI